MSIRQGEFNRHLRPQTLEALHRQASREGVDLTPQELEALRSTDRNGDGVLGNSPVEARALWQALDRFDSDPRPSQVGGRAYEIARVLAPGADPLAGLRASPESMRTINETDRVLREATALERNGRDEAARTTLVRHGDAMIERGEHFEARRVFERLREVPHRDAPVHLLRDPLEAHRRAHPDQTHPPRTLRVEQGGTVTRMDPAGFQSTHGALAERRLQQLEQHDRMSTIVGRPIDPRNPDHAREYFTRYSQGRGTDAVRQEYQRYLENFYVHSGQDVDWTDRIPSEQRRHRLGELLGQQPSDGAGRTVVDCEGFADISQHVLSGARTADGEQRFRSLYAARPTHIISGVYDRDSGRAFTVNNADTRMVPGEPRDMGAVSRHITREIAADRATVIGFGTSPDEASPIDDTTGRPRLGSLVWRDGEPRGVVDLNFLDRYDAALRNHELPSQSRVERLRMFIERTYAAE